MKRLTILLAVGAFVAWAAMTAVTAAEEEAVPPRKEPVAKERGPETREGTERKRMLPPDTARLAEACDLSQEQQKKLVELNEVRQKAIQEINAKYQTDLAVVLTPEQKAKWNQTILMGMVERNIAKRLNLTPQQMDKIRDAVPEMTKDVLLGPDMGGGEVMRKLWDFITKDVLTDEQRAAMRQPERREGEGTAQPPKAPEKKPSAAD